MSVSDLGLERIEGATEPWQSDPRKNIVPRLLAEFLNLARRVNCSPEASPACLVTRWRVFWIEPSTYPSFRSFPTPQRTPTALKPGGVDDRLVVPRVPLLVPEQIEVGGLPRFTDAFASVSTILCGSSDDLRLTDDRDRPRFRSHLFGYCRLAVRTSLRHDCLRSTERSQFLGRGL